MKRSDRLAAIVMALQTGTETAQSLADKFEVSKRTILRDMQALSEIGVPFYASSGPVGGYRLMDGYKLPPLQFSPLEAMTVLCALQGMTQLADTPFNAERWSALDKIKQALPEQVRSEIEPVMDKLILSMPKRNYRVPMLNRLMDHAAEGIWIRAHYRSANQARWLRLRPLRIVTAHGFWYCEAFSLDHEEERTFRVDRFQEIERIEDAAELEAARLKRSRIKKTRDAREDEIPIRARLTYRGALLAEQDEHIGDQVLQIGEEEWAVEFACPRSEWAWAVRFFYGLGPEGEVLAPAALRREIRERAARMCERYAADEPAGELDVRQISKEDEL
ncbi:helix-turn-helix transcriptional regulator [Paenibacillus thiaminolyticus]|uniref:helix-turn-helix transcriptional regulator n=1 Tax=Paenibacillus thiaminolyticus TaxID=49283 RepID=UPI00254355DF|nr:WYL domain-containing protein [Paenibacillus thiaminolyticus]WII35095.1 WYL domain-containing protein [Paenibacillus thiaminolyticus]